MEFSIDGPSGRLQTVLLLLLGIASVGYGAYSYNVQSSALDSGVEVEATLNSTSVEEVSQRRGVGYVPRATLTYRYDGKEYSSSNVYPGELPREFDTEDAAESVLDGYDTGDTVTAYVPPESPDDAYIKHESSNKPFLIIGIGVLFVVGGVRSFL
ncbi:DUF3592 domain-containing protein [Halorutilales archaeon Cl-col2-1]